MDIRESFVLRPGMTQWLPMVAVSATEECPTVHRRPFGMLYSLPQSDGATCAQHTFRSSACAFGKQPLVHVSRCASLPPASEQLRQQSAMLVRKAGCARTPGVPREGIRKGARWSSSNAARRCNISQHRWQVGGDSNVPPRLVHPDLQYEGARTVDKCRAGQAAG